MARVIERNSDTPDPLELVTGYMHCTMIFTRIGRMNFSILAEEHIVFKEYVCIYFSFGTSPTPYHGPTKHLLGTTVQLFGRARDIEPSSLRLYYYYVYLSLLLLLRIYVYMTRNNTIILLCARIRGGGHLVDGRNESIG